MLKLAQEEKSLWREVYAKSQYPQLASTLSVDVVVIGAGITGLTAAYLLKKSGQTVAVLDKSGVGGGTSGRTTGKVTSQHNLIYADLKNRLGLDTAKIYGKANQSALEQVASIIKKEKIDCNFKREDNYVFTADPKQIKKFKREALAAKDADLPASFEATAPLPFEISGAVKFANQASIHSQKYLLGLAKAINGNGSYVLENSKVRRIKDGKSALVKTSKGQVNAKNIIVATNVPTLPLAARGAYCLYEYPTESYIVAGFVKKGLAGMYISPDKDHYSVLPVNMDGNKMILIGGESHISGLRVNKKAKYERLAEYGEKHFGLSEITHNWSDRDYTGYDSLPLIGKLYPWSKHLYVASAFNKWGLTGGTAAAMLLHLLIMGGQDIYAPIVRPNRLQAAVSFPRVAVKHLNPFS